MKRRVFLMKNTMIISVILFVGLFLSMGCSEKAQAQSGARSSGGNASPVSDFSYDLSKDGKGIKITGYTGNGGRVVIPSTIEDMPVVEIRFNAFQGYLSDRTKYFPANNITEIIIPSSVTVIESRAFYLNENLTKVTLPDGIKVFEDGVFRNCVKLTSVNLPAELEVIGAHVFADCGELNNLVIPVTITSIKFIELQSGVGNNYAFSGCGKLPIKTRQTIQALGYPNGF